MGAIHIKTYRVIRLITQPDVVKKYFSTTTGHILENDSANMVQVRVITVGQIIFKRTGSPSLATLLRDWLFHLGQMCLGEDARPGLPVLSRMLQQHHEGLPVAGQGG